MRLEDQSKGLIQVLYTNTRVLDGRFLTQARRWETHGESMLHYMVLWNKEVRDAKGPFTEYAGEPEAIRDPASRIEQAAAPDIHSGDLGQC